MPNAFRNSPATHGIIENNKYHENVVGGMYTIPSDWHIIISYNPSIYQGMVSISTVVEEFTAADTYTIENSW